MQIIPIRQNRPIEDESGPWRAHLSTTAARTRKKSPSLIRVRVGFRDGPIDPDTPGLKHFPSTAGSAQSMSTGFAKGKSASRDDNVCGRVGEPSAAAGRERKKEETKKGE